MFSLINDFFGDVKNIFHFVQMEENLLLVNVNYTFLVCEKWTKIWSDNPY